MVRPWAKLCAALIQHWLAVMLARRSESRLSFDGIAKHVGSIADASIGALTGYDDLLQVLERFKKIDPPVVFAALDHRLMDIILIGHETKGA